MNQFSSGGRASTTETPRHRGSTEILLTSLLFFAVKYIKIDSLLCAVSVSLWFIFGLNQALFRQHSDTDEKIAFSIKYNYFNI